MATQINSFKTVKNFRWHDAGDIQSVKHLLKIFKVCKLTPTVKHWMPTKEAQFLKFIPVNRIPKNLILDYQEPMLTGPRASFGSGQVQSQLTLKRPHVQRQLKAENV
jgi:hypothetical protein